MSNIKKFILVINPIAGDIDKSEIEYLVKDYALNLSTEIIAYYTTGKNDEDELKKLYILHNPERILIAGGDGTIKMVAEVFENEDVIFGIFPAGSANGLSVDLELPTTIEENLRICFSDKFIEMDMISINSKRCIHLSDLGINAELVKNYEKSNIRGKLGYALQVFTTLSDLEDPFDAIINANNQNIDCTASIIVIANSKKYGTGVVINPEGKIDDGKFELVIIKNLDLIVFGKIITGNMPLESGDVQIISTNQATIKTLKPVNFQIDGEYIGQEMYLEIKILPAKLKITVT